MDDCKIATTVAVMILISTFNFQFFMRRRRINVFPSGENTSLVRRTNFTAKQLHSPKANFTATQSPWSPFPQGKADGCRNDFNFNFQFSIFHAPKALLFSVH